MRRECAPNNATRHYMTPHYSAHGRGVPCVRRHLESRLWALKRRASGGAGLHGAVLQVFLFGDKLDVFRLDYGGGYCHDSRDAGYEPLAALPSLA